MRAVALALLLPTLAFAQTPASRPEDLGTVTGHITCADSQRPARLAQVELIAVHTAPHTGHESPAIDPGMQGPVHTDLTGEYTITGVPPGEYYLRVDLIGYATPIAQFTRDELNSPTPQIQQQIKRELQWVMVTPNSTVQSDASIRRAGSITGTVTFDDGSPAINVGIALLRRDTKGSLQPVRTGTVIFTNSHGQFSLESLAAGEYVIEARLNEFQRGRATIVSDGRLQDMLVETMPSFLRVYSGSVFRSKDAAPIKVDEGQETDNADVTISLDQLHEISGTLVAKDGHSINAGQIELLDPDTHEQTAAAWTDSNGSFHISRVPEGSYTLRITHASDMGPTEVQYGPNHAIASFGPRALRTYGDLEQPLTVQSDLQSINLIVPNKPSTTASK